MFQTITTICPGSSDFIYIISYYIKWVTTSQPHSRSKRETRHGSNCSTFPFILYNTLLLTTTTYFCKLLVKMCNYLFTYNINKKSAQTLETFNRPLQQIQQQQHTCKNPCSGGLGGLEQAVPQGFLQSGEAKEKMINQPEQNIEI